jgi:hypothetical protein
MYNCVHFTATKCIISYDREGWKFILTDSIFSDQLKYLNPFYKPTSFVGTLFKTSKHAKILFAYRTSDS